MDKHRRSPLVLLFGGKTWDSLTLGELKVPRIRYHSERYGFVAFHHARRLNRYALLLWNWSSRFHCDLFRHPRDAQ
ncbi:hypothetical protein OKW34_001666 [Paraburkholderia youngii]|uniref:hypothetical protein n=1 Tax=Paraburkholderia youngii TaxID=2782701 RepID=UPI003D1A19B9